MQRFLQLVGVVGLVAWTGLGLFAWDRARQGVAVTVGGSSSADGEPVALLADRVDVLAADVRGLAAALESNFGALVEGLEAEALHAAEAPSSSDATALAELDAKLSSVLERLERGARGEDAAPAVARPALALPAATVESAPTDVPPAVAEPAPRRSFLAFALPSSTFSFAGRQRFAVLADVSRVGFDAKSTLHDFSGASDSVAGSFTVDLARPAAGVEGRLEVDATSLLTGLDGRDDAMHEHLDAAAHRTLSFVPSAFEAEQVDEDALRVVGTVVGDMTIRGTTRELRMPVTAHVDEGKRLVLEGEAPLLLSDFGVPVPNKLGMISMEDQVSVWIRLRLRARAEEVQR